MGQGPDLPTGQESLVYLEPVLTLGGVPQLEVEDPGDHPLVGGDSHQPAAVETCLVVLGIRLGHEDGGSQ